LLGRYTLDQADGILENGEADTLYHNDGGGHFTPVPWNQGAFLDEKGNPILILQLIDNLKQCFGVFLSPFATAYFL
jgi:hypothetical protein